MPHQTVLPRVREKCGVCGIFGHEDAARLAYFGLYALQHRGQKGAGLISHDGKRTWRHKGIGLVPEIFTEKNLHSLKGTTALGHVQDTIFRDTSIVNIQPFIASHRGRTISVAHNGSLTNIQALRNELQDKGAIFHSFIDSEVVVHLLARCGDMDLESALESVFWCNPGPARRSPLVVGEERRARQGFYYSRTRRSPAATRAVRG